MSVPTPFLNSDPTSGHPAAAVTDPVAVERVEARKRLDSRRKIVSDVVSYVVINAFLVFVWFVTGAGYFWPGWVMAGWGILLALHAWDVFWRRPITEAEIDQEVSRRR
ncbi:MAG TPA: 2TM domain-containing protein [Actinomycetes bacterium]